MNSSTPTCKVSPCGLVWGVPSPNTLKKYVEGGYYHAYNRGVAKQDIFKEEEDYMVFLSYLKEALSPGDKKESKAKDSPSSDRRPKNFSDEIELIAFCLMPNHFHLLLKQKKADSMARLMRSVGTRYSIYFNKKYDRVGKLFQGVYKAIIVPDDALLLHLSRYIHLNPLSYMTDIKEGISSYLVYLGEYEQDWIKSKSVLDFFEARRKSDFNDLGSYEDFVEKHTEDSASILGGLTLEEEEK